MSGQGHICNNCSLTNIAPDALKEHCIKFGHYATRRDRKLPRVCYECMVNGRNFSTYDLKEMRDHKKLCKINCDLKHPRQRNKPKTMLKIKNPFAGMEIHTAQVVINNYNVHCVHVDNVCETKICANDTMPDIDMDLYRDIFESDGCDEISAEHPPYEDFTSEDEIEQEFEVPYDDINDINDINDMYIHTVIESIAESTAAPPDTVIIVTSPETKTIESVMPDLADSAPINPEEPILLDQVIMEPVVRVKSIQYQYKCTECTDTFRRKNQLYAHKCAMHPKINCNVKNCTYKCYTKAGLNCHMTRSHKNIYIIL